MPNDHTEATLTEFAHQAGSQRREAADITGALDDLRVINLRQSEAFRRPAD